MSKSTIFRISSIRRISMAAVEETPEKRKAPRYLARIAIFYGLYQKDVLSDYSINLSTGGVFIESTRIMPEGTELTVKFNLPDSDIIIVANARVAWTNNPGMLKKEALPPGMGLQFLDLSLEDMHLIRSSLENGKFVPTW
jgi:uncharacterized protein (TIGR02266 family)